MKTLKPCPFCGGEDVHIDTRYGHCWIECKNCKSNTRTFSIDETGRLISFWNNRAVDEKDKMIEAMLDTFEGKCPRHELKFEKLEGFDFNPSWCGGCIDYCGRKEYRICWREYFEWAVEEKKFCRDCKFYNSRKSECNNDKSKYSLRYVGDGDGCLEWARMDVDK